LDVFLASTGYEPLARRGAPDLRFPASFPPIAWRAYHRMTEQGLRDHLILVVAAQGRIQAVIRPREECWRLISPGCAERGRPPTDAPGATARPFWVVLIDDKPDGPRLQVAGFDGDVGVAMAARSGRLRSRGRMARWWS